MIAPYEEFLEKKKQIAKPSGFECEFGHDWLFPHQRHVCRVSAMRGRNLIIAGTGLGKTRMELALGDACVDQTGKPSLIIAPLGVVPQTVEEGLRVGVEIVRHGRGDAPVQIINYDRLKEVDPSKFGAVIPDEASIMKNLFGATKQLMCSMFAETPYRFPATWTPAPNDHTEFGSQAEFLGIMTMQAMLARFFVHDSGQTSEWRLKGHGKDAFWKWLRSWATCYQKPSDLNMGFSDDGYILPALHMIQETVETEPDISSGKLISDARLSATTLHTEMRKTSPDRAARVAEIIAREPDETWFVLCETDYEAEDIRKSVPGIVEVKGKAMSDDLKEARLLAFGRGEIPRFLSKSSIVGMGMNYQKCARIIISASSYSFERKMQVIRRCWRFGQEREVYCYLINTAAEWSILEAIDRKKENHEEMVREMVKVMNEGEDSDIEQLHRDDAAGRDWRVLFGDNVRRIKEVDTGSVGYIMTSPPFASLFTYSDHPSDMGNCLSDAEFFEHLGHLVPEIKRVMMPGRLVSLHCMDLPKSKERDGVTALRDFPGDLIRLFQDNGFEFHSRVTIWKDPLVAMQRTKAIGLLHKQLLKDSAMSRQGIADYVITMRAPGANPEPVTHGDGFASYVGESGPNEPLMKNGAYNVKYSHEVWQRYASPVWMDIDQGDVLKYTGARAQKDERHICLARGSLVLTSTGYHPIECLDPGDMVLTHKGRWRPISAVANTGVRTVVTVRAQGVPGLTLTPEHKVWTRKGRKGEAKKATPSWVAASDSLGSHLNHQSIPDTCDVPIDDQELWLIGRWIADGHRECRRGYMVSIGANKLDAFKVGAGIHYGAETRLSAIQVRLVAMSDEAKRLLAECGSGASSKRIPTSLMGLSRERSLVLLNGYLSGDGHYLASRNRYMASTVSKELAFGLSVLAQRAHGAIASVYPGRAPGSTVIEGRTVNTKQDWIICWDVPDDDRRHKPFILDDGAWKRVREIKDAGMQETWCIQVEDDESFHAEGCVVANCPLQLPVIRRGIELWTNPGDLVMDPFNGIGSTGCIALEMSRKYIGLELKPTYFDQSVLNLTNYANMGEGQISFEDLL